MICFGSAGQRFGLPLVSVHRVVHAVSLTVLPGAPHSIRGIFSFHGTLIPVGDLRRRLGLPEREIDPADCIILAHTPRRLLGVLSEGGVEVVKGGDEPIVPVASIAPADDSIRGVMRLESGLLLIQDLARFLSLDEERQLDRALADG